MGIEALGSGNAAILGEFNVCC